MTSIAELKSRLQAMNSRANKPKDMLSFKDTCSVRMVKYPNREDPFLDLYFHYEVDVNPVLCPLKNFGEDCAICEAAAVFAAWKDANGQDKPESKRKEDFEIFKKIQVKGKVVVPVVKRGAEAEGIKFWSIPQTTVNQLLETCINPERRAACGLSVDDDEHALDVLLGEERAFDLNLKKLKAGSPENPKKYDVTTVDVSIVPKPLAPSKEERTALLATVKDIFEVHPKVTSAEVSRIWKKFVGQGAPAAKPEGGTEKYSGKQAKVPAPTNSGEDAKSPGKRSIEEAFGEIS